MPHLSPLYRYSDGFVCGFRFWPNFFAVLDDFFFGFAVSNTPHCPPLQSLVGCDSRSVLSFCLLGVYMSAMPKFGITSNSTYFRTIAISADKLNCGQLEQCGREALLVVTPDTKL